MQNDKDNAKEKQQLLCKVLFSVFLFVAVNAVSYRLGIKVLYIMSIIPIVYMIVSCIQYTKMQQNRPLSFEDENVHRKMRGVKNEKNKSKKHRKQQLANSMLIALLVFALLNLLSVNLNYSIFDIVAIIPAVYIIIGFVLCTIEK